MYALLVAAALAAIPEVGAQAPDFSVKDTDGKQLALSELVKKGPVILAFFPRAFTSGCTQQMTAFTARHDDVVAKQGTLIAISQDDVDALKKFKASVKAPFHFVSDADGKLTNAYDVKMPVVSMSKRYTFTVGDDRKVLSVVSGGDAVNPEPAIAACSLRPSKPAEAPAPAPATKK